MRTGTWSMPLVALSLCLLVSCGPEATPTTTPVSSLPSHPATLLAISTRPASPPPPSVRLATPTRPYYPPPPTPLPPTAPPPSPTPPPPLPALPLLEAAPAADWNMEEVVLLGISQTERMGLQVRLRSGETRLARFDPQVVPAGVLYRTEWAPPYLVLDPVYQPVTVSVAPLLVVELTGKVLYRMEIPRGYWVRPFVLSPDRRQAAFMQVRQWGEEYRDIAPGPHWEVRVWDLVAGQVRTLSYADSTNEPYYPVYWSSEADRLYLQRVIFESDAPPQELAVVSPDGFGWQVNEQVRGHLAFSPDGLFVAYLLYEAQLEAGHTYYNGYPVQPYNQLWVLDLQTGDSHLLLQEEEGAQYNADVLQWTEAGLLVERFQAESHSTIKEWELLRVNQATGEATPVLRQQGQWAGPFIGLFSPRQDRWLLWNWTDDRFAVLDLTSGKLQEFNSPLPMGTFLWCLEGRSLVDQYGEQLYYVNLETMTTESLDGWSQVAFCR